MNFPTGLRCRQLWRVVANAMTESWQNGTDADFEPGRGFSATSEILIRVATSIPAHCEPEASQAPAALYPFALTTTDIPTHSRNLFKTDHAAPRTSS
jgi:hypothetical protein